MKFLLLCISLFLFLGFGLSVAPSVQAATLDTVTITDISNTVVAAGRNNIGLFKLVLQDGDAGNLTSVEVHFTAAENDLDRIELWTDDSGDGLFGMGDQPRGYTGSSDGSVNALSGSSNATFTRGGSDGGIGTGNISADINLSSSQTLFIVIEMSVAATNDNVVTAQILTNKIVAGSDSGPVAPSVEASLLIDSAAPEVSAIGYQDVDNNGSVDSVEITFSEALDIDGMPSSSTDLNDFAYTAGDITDSVLSGGSAAYTDSTHLLITLATPGAANITSHTTAPTLAHTFSAPQYEIIDEAGNRLTDFGATNIDDGAVPYLLSGSYYDNNGNGAVDRISLLFSEAVSFTYETADFDFTAPGDINLSGDFDAADCTTDSTTITCTDLDNSDLSADSNKTGKQTAGGSEPSWRYQNLGTAGSVKDASNNATASRTITLTDLARPVVASTTPANGYDGYLLSGDVTLNFSEIMNTSTLTADNITCSPSWGTPIFTVSGSNDSVTINPAINFSSSTEYTVTSGTGVQDAQSQAKTSGSITFTTLPDVPTSLASASVTTSGATVSWTAPGGTIASYVLEYSKNADMSTSTTVSDIAATTADLSGLDSNTTYYYRVKAYSGSVYSSYTDIESFTTSAEEIDVPDEPDEPDAPDEDVPDEPDEPDAPDEGEAVNQIEDIVQIIGSTKGEGKVTLYGANNEELCSISAWPVGGAVAQTIKIQNEYYISVIKNQSGSTMHLYNLNCGLVTKKKLSPRLHPRNFDVGEILNKKVSQEIVVAAHRGTGIYVKVMRYDLNNDRWRVLKEKHFKNVPKHKYEIKAKGKTNTVLIKNINTGKVYYKWKVGK